MHLINTGTEPTCYPEERHKIETIYCPNCDQGHQVEVNRTDKAVFTCWHCEEDFVVQVKQNVSYDINVKPVKQK